MSLCLCVKQKRIMVLFVNFCTKYVVMLFGHYIATVSVFARNLKFRILAHDGGVALQTRQAGSHERRSGELVLKRAFVEVLDL